MSGYTPSQVSVVEVVCLFVCLFVLARITQSYGYCNPRNQEQSGIKVFEIETRECDSYDRQEVEIPTPFIVSC